MAFSFKHLLHILYPPLCLHCQTALTKRLPLFCSTCLEQITLIETQDRCRTCFRQLDHGRCDRCIHRSVVIRHQLAACETFGPSGTLLNALKQGRREAFPAAASLMVYQWLQQKHALPDLIIPFPVSFLQKQKLGFDMHFFLAQEIGKLFSLPTHRVLKRKFDRAHFLTEGEFRIRHELSKKNQPLCDKRLLLIAPQLNDALCRQAGEELRTAFPMQVDVLAFATS